MRIDKARDTKIDKLYALDTFTIHDLKNETF